MRPTRRMGRALQLALMFPALLAVNAAGLKGQPIISDFEGGTNDGWTVFDNYSSTTADFNATGGNPNGYISDFDDGPGIWWFVAPAQFMGNFSTYLGETLFVDRNQDLVVNAESIDGVIIDGGGTSLHHSLPAPSVGSWETHSVVLDTSATWTVGSSEGPAATPADFTTVLTSVTMLRIRGDYNTGYETTGLDNVVLTPVELQHFSIE